MHVRSKMNCEQARNLFDAYLDGELSAALETELAAHRLRCADCRHELALLEVAGHVIRSGDAAARSRLPDEFSDRLLACLDEPRVRGRRWRLWTFRIGSGFAAAACLVLLIGYWARPEPRVAPFVQAEGELGAEAEGEGVPAVERPLTAADFDAVAKYWQKKLESSVEGTRQSSDSLRELGRMTALEMIDALRLQELRDPDPRRSTSSEPGAAGPDSPPESSHADDVEDL